MARPSRIRLWAPALMVVLLVALAVAWSTTPLSRLLDPRTLSAYEQQVRAWPMAPLAVVALYVIAGLIATPATLMIGATVLLFGAWPGSLYAFVGMIVNATVIYAIGRFTARDTVAHWLAGRTGSRLARIDGLLARRGIVAMALVRLAPIPYSIVNVVAGASRVGFVDFLVGTAIGILPVIALMAGVASEVDAWLAHPAWDHLLELIGVCVVVVAIAWSLRRRAWRDVEER